EFCQNVQPFIEPAIALVLRMATDLFFSQATTDSLFNFGNAIKQAKYVRSNGATLQLKTRQGTRLEMTAPSLLYAQHAAKNFTDESSVALSVLLHQLAPCTDYSALITIVQIFDGYHSPNSSPDEILDFKKDSGKLSLKGGSNHGLYLYDLVKKS